MPHVLEMRVRHAARGEQDSAAMISDDCSFADKIDQAKRDSAETALQRAYNDRASA
jgi:hypothetical protein